MHDAFCDVLDNLLLIRNPRTRVNVSHFRLDSIGLLVCTVELLDRELALLRVWVLIAVLGFETLMFQQGLRSVS